MKQNKIFCDLMVGTHFSFKGHKENRYVKKGEFTAIRTQHSFNEAGSILHLDSYARSYPVHINLSLDNICNYIRNQCL